MDDITSIKLDIYLKFIHFVANIIFFKQKHRWIDYLHDMMIL